MQSSWTGQAGESDGAVLRKQRHHGRIRGTSKCCRHNKCTGRVVLQSKGQILPASATSLCSRSKQLELVPCLDPKYWNSGEAVAPAGYRRGQRAFHNNGRLHLRRARFAETYIISQSSEASYVPHGVRLEQHCSPVLASFSSRLLAPRQGSVMFDNRPTPTLERLCRFSIASARDQANTFGKYR